ncbi:MAG: Signal peptidase [Clostridiales bacterium]|jgi:signal peptidase I|nr:Signal peptidase [Clostridiales bacterium]
MKAGVYMSSEFEKGNEELDNTNEENSINEVNTEKKPSLKKELISLLIDLAIVFAIVFIVITFVGIRTSVIGRSMAPTLQNNDQLIIDKISYRFTEPKRFDIIVFPSGKEKEPGEKYYIKRIIGLPGETVLIDDGSIYIDGVLLDDPYAYGAYTENKYYTEAKTLDKDEYFVLGDNRAISLDSRYSDVGAVKRDIIVGKAIFRLFPFKNFGGLK